MTNWANEADRFWTTAECDGLFLLFDASAEVNNGVPDVDSDAVLAHVAECPVCQDSDVRVSLLTDGTEQLEGGSVN